MTDTINEARALLAMATYGAEEWDTSAFPDTIETADRRLFAAAPRLIADLVADLEAARAELAATRQERDTEADAVTEQRDTIKSLRAELAAARAAMPSDHVRDCIDFAISCESAATVEQRMDVLRWLRRFDAYHAAHPAASTPSTTANGGEDE